MKHWIIFVCVLSLFSFSPPLFSQIDPDPAVDELIEDQEHIVEDDIEYEINSEYNELEEEGGIITVDYGPIPQNMYVDIANGELETYQDRYDRFDSYFGEFETVHEEIHLAEGSEEHVHNE